MTLPELMIVIILTGLLCICIIDAWTILARLGAGLEKKAAAGVSHGNVLHLVPLQDSVCRSMSDSLMKNIAEYEEERIPAFEGE